MEHSKNKGFTLIELLAVIVILAIIALIATPLIMGVINNARKNAAKNNVYGYVKAVELAIVSNISEEVSDLDGMYTIDGKTIKLGTTTISVNYKGNTVTGELRVYNNAVDYGTFKSGSYDVTYHDGVAYIAGEAKTTTAYADGTAVYFNPDTGTKCTQAEYTSNNGSATNKKTGCMRWYTFGDKTGNTTVKMILDHNTSNGTPWISKADFIKAGGTEEEYDQKDSDNEIMGNNSKGPITVTNKLKDDTKDWKQEISPRLITANEVAAITGKNDFDSKTFTGYGYWFKGNGNKISAGTGAYAWLYSYLKNCEEYGCNKQDQSASWGYATSDKHASMTYRAWYVYSNGRLDDYTNVSSYDFAVRPVITLSKSKLA
jgi:type IV pilus assembly protein PilA